ncbi:DNA-binding response regulator [Chroococcidiopsis sp. CCALA 051]|uniref:two-component system response regulator RppA n=1 Tax=Chroococcidiopsis sp. CCALA 051 TaxID=869949 RepID=UPI000D0CD77B|nr:two-component system response regulator RppA [Chroococcidiopsis sp. CCALA 051]MBE9016985.1 response regulator transcription factor [Chroococcidiopsidales cyanobacterium LEGE 13417]PSM47047.1 DNA-binding response regulator [Chroococcidiopsis sp. CCALA 051]
MRVLLVEDEPDLGTAIKRTLNQEKYVVDLVFNGTEAWDYLENQQMQYTLAIFDWLLPGMSGVELCKRLRRQNSPLPVLMLTAKDSVEDRVAGLSAGADDYLVKPFSMAELLARVKALHRRSPQLQPQQLQAGNLILDYDTRSVYRLERSGGKQLVELTNKEFQLLEYFMKHPNRIVTSEQIRNQLWEVTADTTSNVVAAQIRLLRRRLAVVDSDRAIETVSGRGYRLNMPNAAK